MTVHALRWVLVIGLLTVLATGSTNAGAADTIEWLALGDSYASGEGLTDSPNALPRSACQRAQGDRDGSAGQIAWPPLVHHAAEKAGWDTGWQNFKFMACTGATSHDIRQQIESAGPLAVDDRFDVVTLSFGGNNTGFSDTLRDCTGANRTEFLLPLVSNCDITFLEASRRILNGGDLNDSAGIRADLTEAFNQLTPHVARDGLVVVTGYPHLISDPDLWGFVNATAGRCSWFLDQDAQMLRDLNDIMTSEIEAAVQAQRDDNRTWLFVDMRPIFDGHELCTDAPWIHSLSNLHQAVASELLRLDYLFSSRAENSFHPNQRGHRAYAEAVVQAIDASEWINTRGEADPSSDGETEQDGGPPDGHIQITVTSGRSCTSLREGFGNPFTNMRLFEEFFDPAPIAELELSEGPTPSLQIEDASCQWTYVSDRPVERGETYVIADRFLQTAGIGPVDYQGNGIYELRYSGAPPWG